MKVNTTSAQKGKYSTGFSVLMKRLNSILNEITTTEPKLKE
jgi:hypothetical protein